MSDSPAFLPLHLANELVFDTAEIADTNVVWKVTRLAEQAYAQGYRDGYSRCLTERGLRDAAKPAAAAPKVDECSECETTGMNCRAHRWLPATTEEATSA